MDSGDLPVHTSAKKIKFKSRPDIIGVGFYTCELLMAVYNFPV